MNEQNIYFRRKLLASGFIFDRKIFFKNSQRNVELNFFFQTTYALFIMCALYASSFLPYGRFYNRVGGNIGMLGAYFYLFFYLTATSLRRPYFYDIYIAFLRFAARIIKRAKIKVVFFFGIY